MYRSKDKAPSAHLTEYASHTTVQLSDGGSERHVVMLEVPGNQTKPSGVDHRRSRFVVVSPALLAGTFRFRREEDTP
jgi:hypothetical protein